MAREWCFPQSHAILHTALSLIALLMAGNCKAATASLQDIQYQEENGFTRVFIHLDSETGYVGERIADPDRVFFDISNSKLSDEFQDSYLYIAVKGTFLRRISAAQNRPGVIRVVLKISETAEYRVSELHNPFRIVVDLFGPATVTTLPNRPPVPSDSTSAKPVVVPQRMPAVDASTSGIGGSLQSAEAPASKDAMHGAAETLLPISSVWTAATLSAEDQPESVSPLIENTLVDEQPSADGQTAIIRAANSPIKANLKRISHTTKQENLSLNISGTLSTGYYNSFTKGGGDENRNIRFMPAGAVLDFSGYFRTPDLLDYSIRTELNAGSQASDAGIEGGNGARIHLTTLRRGAFPTTFRYSNMQLKDAYFGSLSQISSYTLKNRNKDLGLTTGLKVRGLPAATLDWGTSSVESQSYNSALSKYTSRSNHINLNCSDHRWGWDLQCFAERLKQTSDLYTPLGEDSDSSLLRQQVRQFRGSARRSLLTDSELYIDGGSQFTSNMVLNRPMDSATRYASIHLRMFQGKKWKASMRAGYTSNVSGLLLTQFVGGLNGNGSVAPDASILKPFQRKTSFLNLNGLTSLDLSHGFSLYGSLDRTAAIAGSESDLSSRYLTTTGGVTFSRSFGWGGISGQYGRSFGMGSITGQTGRIVGQEYFVSVQPGNSDGLLLDISLRGNDQSTHNEMPAREHSFASDLGVGFPLAARLRMRLGGGWQRSSFSNQGSDFRIHGYSARIGIEHPRFQLHGSLNSNAGNSLQSYGQAFGGIAVESMFLTPVRIVPSDLRGITVTFRLIPIQKLELSALFTRSIQHIEGIVANDFQVVDVFATYHFRLLKLVAGYFSSTQIYSSHLAVYPAMERGRFYVRISRPIRFL